MEKFKILFKHELKMQFPWKPQRGKRVDILGSLLSIVLILFIAFVFVTLLSTVASNYVLVQMNKIPDPIGRMRELLNVCYGAVIIALVLSYLESMRKTLTEKRHKDLFLRLPVKQQTIFISKLMALMIRNYILALLLIVPLNMIFYLSVELDFTFWIMTVFVWLLMPMTSFLIATALLVPYIKLLDFISNKYTLMFLSITAIVIGAFWLYSGFLDVVKSLLETGSIKFLFNEKFVVFLQNLLVWLYPANCFADMALGTNLLKSFAISVLIAAVAVFVVYFVSKKLFYATLYKNENRKQTGKPTERARKLSPLLSLIKKEFICIFREPKNLFSYFAIAASMPVMVYSCYTLFESLILNMIGLKLTYPLAILVVLIFSILTNTFCSTNITRDGEAALKVKMFPLKASTILLAKVLLCAAVSSLSIIISLFVLALATPLVWYDALFCGAIAIVFSMAQIFIATRMDLNGAKLTSSIVEMQSRSNKTIAKVVTLGIILALVVGIISVVCYIFSAMKGISFIDNLSLKPVYAYLFPAGISALYFAFSVFYYSFKIEKSLEGLVL